MDVAITTTSADVAITTTESLDPEVLVLVASYEWMKPSDRVKELQRLLGVGDDGIYGYVTRDAHVLENEERGLGVEMIPVPPVEIVPVGREVEPGSNYTVSGSGFTPGSTATSTLYSDPVFLGSGVADERGRVSIDVEIPSDTPLGDHTLELSGLSFEGEETAITTPIVIGIDTSGPVFGSASVSFSSVDVTSGAQTIDVSFSASDDISGVGVVNLDLSGDGGFSEGVGIEGTCMGCALAYLTSGTIQNGTWTATVELPAGLPSQTVTVYLSPPIRDNAFNYSHVYDDESFQIEVASFEIVNTG
tara:strand:- start:175 stop:1086 length:912 start_codon:yes stop_codon:yes gene_type:complete